MILLLSTVAADVTFADLKGFTYTHPVVDVNVYDTFTEEDIEESSDFATLFAAGDFTLKDSSGNLITNLDELRPMYKSVYDADDDGKIDGSASQVESVNGLTGMVTITDTVFTGTSGVAGTNQGSVPDDGVASTGKRVLHDDASFKALYLESSDYRSEFTDGYVYSGANLGATYYIKRENLTVIEIATNVTDLDTDWANKELLTYT